MTVSIRRLSLGAGFAYLMNSVARGDGSTSPASSLTRYYAESGTPPGVWLGSGLAGLAEGRGLSTGTVVSEQQLWRLLGMMADPVTGSVLGAAPMAWPGSTAARIAARIQSLPDSLSTADQTAMINAIEAEERRREASVRRPVAAFDLTFSVAKSVSALWAVADADIQAAIHAVHREAVALVLAWAEQHVVFTRTGKAGAVQESVRGVIAAAFDHWDSRAGDPHLHTHVVVANRVQTLDGRWRTLDSRTLHRYTVALSELHEGVVQDLLTARLGVDWTGRPRRHSPVPRYDIVGVPTELIDAFSQRSSAIASEKDDLMAAFAATHGRHPTDVEILRLRQQAALSTRPEKTHHTLVELCAEWRTRAAEVTGADPAARISKLARDREVPTSSIDSMDPVMVSRLADIVLQTVGEKRATFGHANVLAESHRQLHGIRFRTPADRIAIADRITTASLQRAILLNPAAPELKLHKGADVYSTRAVFDAETRLLEVGRDITAAAVPTDDLNLTAATEGIVLGADQVSAVADVATSGRRLDVLVGPAGTGKTTSLRALRGTWESYYGPGSVVGLAPSAVAAEVLAEQLGIAAENTAKWLFEHARTPDRDAKIAHVQGLIDECSSLGSVRGRRFTCRRDALAAERDRWTLRPGQLVILDEASLAATLPLDQIASIATKSGAKLLLVGDPCQLGPVDAGGAFTMLTNDRDSVAQLSDPRRFSEAWERDATLQLRTGHPAAVNAYIQHGRVWGGDRDPALTHVLELWIADQTAGLGTIMIAADHDSVAQLNHAARAHLITAGTVSASGVPTADGAAGVGDHVTTRRNDRTLRYGSGRTDWVRNGDAWTVTGTLEDGSMTARNESGAAIELPAGYVREHVELGYAITAHLAQGRTVDTAHVLVTTATTREALYVAATRGRRLNTLTAVTEDSVDPDTNHEPGTAMTEHEVLVRALANNAADTSAHATLSVEHKSHQVAKSDLRERRDKFRERTIQLRL